MKLKNKLTVIIPCKNESLLIKRTLTLLNMQNFIQDTRVIIADSSTDDDLTVNTIKSALLKNLKIEIIKGGLPAIARNNGAKLAKTPYILFLDADVFVQNPYLLFNMVSEMEENSHDLATVNFRTDDGKFNHIYSMFDMVQSIYKHFTPFALGGFMMFNRLQFIALGGFDNEDKFAEDYHLSSKVSPKKFFIKNEIVYTTSRRFENKGAFYMVKMLLKSWLNRNNEDFFKSDHNYWN